MQRSIVFGLLMMAACSGYNLQFADGSCAGSGADAGMGCDAGRASSESVAGEAGTTRDGIESMAAGAAGLGDAEGHRGGDADDDGGGAASGAAGASQAGSMAGSGGEQGSAGTSAVGCGNGIVEDGEKCDGNCPGSCSEPMACTVFELKGSSASCDAECVRREISDVKSGDGCCPDDATAGDDADCPKSCGDGILDSTETCEPESTDKPCPTEESCDDRNLCTMDILVGSAEKCTAACEHTPMTPRSVSCDDGDPCTDDTPVMSTTSCSYECMSGARKTRSGPQTCDDGDPCTKDERITSEDSCSYECEHTPILRSTDSDGCCPNRATARDDNDCQAECGNEVVEPGEQCDGNCPTCETTDPCYPSRLVGSAAACDARCSVDAITESVDDDGCCIRSNAGDNDCNTDALACEEFTDCRGDDYCIDGVCKLRSCSRDADCTHEEDYCLDGTCGDRRCENTADCRSGTTCVMMPNFSLGLCEPRDS